MALTAISQCGLATLVGLLSCSTVRAQAALVDTGSQAAPKLRFGTRDAGGRGTPHFVDSVRVHGAGLTVYGHYGLANVGDGVVARLTAVGDYLILELITISGTQVGAIAVSLEYTAEIANLRPQRYVLVVRDMPPTAFSANAGYSSILDIRTGEEVDVRRLGPW